MNPRAIHIRSSAAFVLALHLLSTQLSAQIPRTLSYQGILSDTAGTPKPDGTYAITFRLYNVANGGSALWSETKSLQVKRGLFSTILGDQTSFPPSLAFDRQYWLSIQPVSNPELSPRIPLSSVGYSLNSEKADTARYAQVAGSGGGSGQWTTNGTSIYYNNGNVGIGSSNPTSKLDIAAQDGLTITGYQPFYTLIDGNSSNARTRVQNASGIFNFFTESDFASGIPAVSIRTVASGSRLLVYGQDGLNTVGYQPFLTLTDANSGYARARVQAVNGDLNLFTESSLIGGTAFMVMKTGSGNVGIGTATPSARLEVIGRTKTGTLEITGGSDLAEPFDSENEESVEPGTVMSIDSEHPGKLIPSQQAYDSKVAGIVSGAGGIHPGLTLRQDGQMEGHTPVAIAGRVYCKAEAEAGSIMPGDLLTTSLLPGYAMKASDHQRSHGAIIGKAMSPLKQGRGLVLVLVNLQ